MDREKGSRLAKGSGPDKSFHPLCVILDVGSVYRPHVVPIAEEVTVGWHEDATLRNHAG